MGCCPVSCLLNGLINGLPVVANWLPLGFPMSCSIWVANGCPMVAQWLPIGLPNGCPMGCSIWVTNSCPMGCPPLGSCLFPSLCLDYCSLSSAVAVIPYHTSTINKLFMNSIQQSLDSRPESVPLLILKCRYVVIQGTL